MKEFTHLLKEHKLLVAIIAVMIVPILYAGMFLWAFWDPYDHLEDVPVAIVNEDEGYEFEGESLAIGNELVDNLKDEPEFNFQFVDKAEGLTGLENEEYYILIEIPKDFSEKSTTMMDDIPEKVQLIYKPNESYNFLAAQIGETAMLQIEQAIEEKIIETYAETIFDNITEVADGLIEASEATDELHDGATELEDGSKTLQDNLQTLASKTVEFSDGVSTAADGVTDLQEGTSTLSSGIAELYDNSNKLRDASEDLEDGANSLTSGITEADEGLQALNENVPALIDGTTQVQDGLTEFHETLPEEMATKVSDTVMSYKDPLRKKITSTFDDKMTEYSPIISNTLTDKIATGAAETVVDEANQMIDQAPKEVSTTIATELVNGIREAEATKKDEVIDEVTTILANAEVEEDTIIEITEKLEGFSPNYDTLEDTIQTKLEDDLDTALASVEITEEQQHELETIIREKATPKVTAGVEEAIEQVAEGVDGALDEYEDLLVDNLDDVTTTLETEIYDALNSPIGQLQSGLTQLNDGQQAVQAGTKQLYAGTNQLKEGSEQLSTGQHDFVENMTKFSTSMGTANSGANELSLGTRILFDGMNELEDGSTQLNDGAQQLSDGSETLYDGMKTLVEGADEFNDEMHEAADEAGDIETDENTYNMIADPVKVKNEKINDVPNYGTGFAPYFLSLGLFVGALLLSIVYPLREPAGVPTSGVNWFFSKFGVLLSVGIFQALIASGFLLLGLGLEVQSVPLFILFSIITSLAFITLIQFFVTCLDNPGRFIAILILIIQLTTSAGTFPLELIPKALQPLNFFFPMTYSVSGFKAVISSGNFTAMWQNAGILVGFAIGFILLTLAYFIVKFKRTYDIHADTLTETNE